MSGRHLRKVRRVAEIAAVGLDQRFMVIEGRMQIGKTGKVVFRRETSRGNPVRSRAICHVVHRFCCHAATTLNLAREF